MSKSGLTRGLLAATVALGFTSLASAQIVTTDGCDHTAAGVPDSNGGCNVTGEPFTSIGVISGNGITTVTGQIGTYDVGGGQFTSRDLDWLNFTLQGTATIQFTLATAAGQNVIFVGNGLGCPANIFAGGVATPTPNTVLLQDLAPGDYKVVVTTPFEADAANPIFACGNYTLTITVTNFNAVPAECGGSNPNPCTTVNNNAGGCDDEACCAQVCAVDPLCCDIAWDQNCVTNGAVAICGYFIYTCPPAANAPANNCATAATLVQLEQVVAFDTTNATTDGPGPVATGAAAIMGKDIWYVIQAPADGELTLNSCASSYDQVIEVYGLGNSSTVTNPADLPNQFIGQVDDTCGTTGGPAQFTLIDAVGGEYYLVRIGGWAPDNQTVPASGPGSFFTSFAISLTNTGAQIPVRDLAAGTNVNLGLSSGALSAAQPRRWLARPFTIQIADDDNAAQLEEIIGKAFIPAGVTVDSLTYIIWNRAEGNPAPVPADQIVAATVPLPTPFDDPIDNAANASWPIVVDPPLVLCPGQYYLTIYGANANDFAAGGPSASNWAWFIYSNGGDRLLDGNGQAFSWRSGNFPAPGFVFYNALNGVYATQVADDPQALYTNAFKLNGTTLKSDLCGGGPPPCPADLNGDGVVGATDLTLLLGAWGTSGPGDLSGDGSVGAPDLTLLLGAWGPCPE